MAKGSKPPRVGDDTLARIEGLKDGWSLPDAGNREDEEDAKTTEVAALSEDQAPTMEASGFDPDDAPTIEAPPKESGPRTKRRTLPPPPPKGAKRGTGKTVPPPLPYDASHKVAKAGATTSEKSPSATGTIDRAVDDEAPTIVRDEPAPAVEIDEEDLPTIAIEDALAQPIEATQGPVRLPDSLPRSPGLSGDVAYLLRVLRFRRSARRRREKLAAQLIEERAERNELLLSMARDVVGDDEFDQTLVDRARAALLHIEEKRSVHAGRIAAAEERSAELKASATKAAEGRAEERRRLESALEVCLKELSLLRKSASSGRRKAAALKRQLQSINQKIQKKEASLVAVDGGADKAAVQSEIASLKAERQTVRADEPAIAAEVETLEPKIEAQVDRERQLREGLAELGRQDEREAERLEENLQALEATQRVQERGVSDQRDRQEKALLDLGEALHSRGDQGEAEKAKAIAAADAKIASLERQRIELLELMDSAESLPMLRGALWLLLSLALVGVLVWFLTAR